MAARLDNNVTSVQMGCPETAHGSTRLLFRSVFHKCEPTAGAAAISAVAKHGRLTV